MFLSASIVAAALAALPLQQGPAKGIQPIPADTEPVVTTASGLKYCVLTKGADGAGPKLGDKVKVQYTGWNTDGSVYQSSRNGPKPAEFTLGDVIDGWNEALLQMTPGAHWKLTIPPQLGYGERGSPPLIKPNATLILEVELLSFEKGVDLPPFHAGDLAIRVLQIAPQYMTVGSRYRFEVPADLVKNFPGFGAPYLPVGSVTVWEIELLSAKEVKLPEFVKPDPAKQTATATGLKYEVLTEGTGAQAANKDHISVRYTGWLTDGTMFDSSQFRGDTYELQLPGQVIPGWNEGLLLMKEGAIYRFEIPSKLGYGARGKGKVPANATLIFLLEMVKVVKQ